MAFKGLLKEALDAAIKQLGVEAAKAVVTLVAA